MIHRRINTKSSEEIEVHSETTGGARGASTDDATGDAVKLVASTRDAYRRLSDPDQLENSQTMAHDTNRGGGPKRRKGPASAPAPVNLDVLDWLVDVDHAALEAAAEVLGATQGDPDPEVETRWSATPAGDVTPPGELTYPAPARPQPGTLGVLDAIAEALPSCPPELGVETGARMWDIARRAAKLLGVDGPSAPRWRCPQCGRQSVTLRPGTAGAEAVCVHRSCQSRINVSDTHPGPSHVDT